MRVGGHLSKIIRMADCHPEKKHFSFGKCYKCYKADYYKKNRKIILARASADYRKRPEERKAAIYAQYIKRFYGITVDDYIRMFGEQNGVCFLCKNPPKKIRFKKRTAPAEYLRGAVLITPKIDDRQF